MGYIKENLLKQKVDDIINSKVTSLIEEKIKQHITNLKEYVFENKKYYLKKDIENGMNSQINMFTTMFSDQIHSTSIDIEKIKSTRGVDGREIKGQRTYTNDNIETYLSDVFTKIKF